MGIKNGAPDIISVIRNGLYNKNAKNYKINIDGELMRYKGMIETNLCKHNAEEAIAATSFDYMKRIIEMVETFMGCRAREVIIFMDGARVFNKETGRSDFRFDANLVRAVFKNICAEYGYTLNELVEGESELQMYLQRDKEVELNIFITNDSDMISICYGHTAKLIPINYKDAEDKGLEVFIEPTTLTDKFLNEISLIQPATVIPSPVTRNATALSGVRVIENTSIIDMNSIYDLSKIKVFDSCLWINSGKNITAIGFDYIEKRLYFTPMSFRTFIAFCGTDFTANLLTDSMISGILLSYQHDIEYLNKLIDINELGACLLVLGLRAGGTIKRFEYRHRTKSFDPDHINMTVRMYLDYIRTGVMLRKQPERPCMNLVCRHYLYAMRGQCLRFQKLVLNTWALNTTLDEAINNLKLYLGTYDPMQMTDERLKSTSRKRKQDMRNARNYLIKRAMETKNQRFTYQDDTSISETEEEQQNAIKAITIKLENDNDSNESYLTTAATTTVSTNNNTAIKINKNEIDIDLKDFITPLETYPLLKSALTKENKNRNINNLTITTLTPSPSSITSTTTTTTTPSPPPLTSMTDLIRDSIVSTDDVCIFKPDDLPLSPPSSALVFSYPEETDTLEPTLILPYMAFQYDDNNILQHL